MKAFDLKWLWTIILGYMISATAKDFTIIIRVVSHKHETTSTFTHKEHIKHEKILTFKGKQYKVRVGVIDLEAKLYTKLPLYIKEVNEAYQNFVKYHNGDAHVK